MSGEALPYYKRYPRDFFEGTIGMSFEVKSAYGLLLDLIYMRNGNLPDDARYIAGNLGCSVRKWNAIREQLISLGKISCDNGIISNFRADYLLEETRKYRDKKAENRKSSSENSDLKKRPSKQPEPEPKPEVSRVELERASADDFRSKCFEAAGLDPLSAMATPGLVSTVQLEHLIRDRNNPCDPELDVLPAIQTCAATLRKRGQTLTNWSYCREAAIRNRDQRLAGNPAPTSQPARGNAKPPSGGKRSDSSFVATGMRLAAEVHARRGIDSGSVGEPGSDASDELAAMLRAHRWPDGASAGGEPAAVAYDDGCSGGEAGSGGDGLGTGTDRLRPEAA